jgi:hypothetical protein
MVSDPIGIQTLGKGQCIAQLLLSNVYLGKVCLGMWHRMFLGPQMFTGWNY